MLDVAARALAVHGLVPRGGFAFRSGEPAPDGPSGLPATSVLLVGQAGAAPWPHFLRWRERQASRVADPLDAWSREVIGTIAGQLGARAVSPSDRPYLPFQRWAMRAEGLRPSPLGILMHPRYGLWHAYRGALLFDVDVGLREAAAAVHACDTCEEKPCLSACLVGAYGADGYDYARCRSHVRGASGELCRTDGCLDRNACPQGREWRYAPEVQAFHMAAFARQRL